MSPQWEASGPKVVSSAALPFDVASVLDDDVRYVAPASGSFSREELLREVTNAVCAITLLDVRVDGELLAAGPELGLVANCAVGYDNVDVAEATRRGVLVTHTPGVLTEATADFAMALLLAAARRLREGEALARSGEWRGWAIDLLLGHEVSGATLGLVGLGRIGAAVAARARGFSMRILYASPRPSPRAEGVGAERVSFDELLAESDYVSLHCPLNDDTEGLIDAAALRRMKPTAILINTARGRCVVEADLAAALAARRIGGAGLDVFAEEPAIHPDLVHSDRVVLAPHLGSATHATRSRMAEICARAVAAHLRGDLPDTALNPEAAS